MNASVGEFFPPRFDPIEEKKELLAYLAENGYVVVKDVADENDIRLAMDSFWDFLEKTNGKIK